MYHPTTRVLTVLELLQSHARLSAREIAARLEVSPRTVRHYIAMLQDLGIPVEGERGRYGAYRLRPGFRLPPLMFTEDEAVALTLGLLTARSFGLTVATPAVEGALAKVERVLPERIRERVQAVQATVKIDTASPYLAPASETLVLFSSAAQARRQVWLRYEAWSGAESERHVDTYGVVHHGGRWFAAGWCHLRADVRVFRLDRVRAIALLDDSFTRPSEIDVVELVVRSIAETPGHWPVEVLLETSLSEAQTLIAPSMAILSETEHGVLMRCAVQQLDWLARFLLSLPCLIQIRGPDALRDELRQIGQRATALATGELVPAAHD